MGVDSSNSHSLYLTAGGAISALSCVWIHVCILTTFFQVLNSIFVKYMSKKMHFIYFVSISYSSKWP